MMKLFFYRDMSHEWSKNDESYKEKTKRDTKVLKLFENFLWFLWWHFQGLEMNWSNPKYKARGVDLFLGQSPKLGHFCPNLPQPQKHDSFNDLVIIHHQNDSDSWENKRSGQRSIGVNWPI